MNRVTVTIADNTYSLLTDGAPEVTQKVAQHVDGAIRAIQAEGHISLADAAILACMNITETWFQELEGAENLRRQLKEYLEESTRLKLELSEAKREIFALKEKK